MIALGLTLYRRLLRGFPIFFSYLAFHVLEALIASLIYRHWGQMSVEYYYEYWIAQAMGLGLRFGVIYEIFYQAVKPYEGLRRGGAIAFRWVGALLLLVAIAVAIIGPGNEPVFAMKGAVVAERSIDVVQCGLLALLFWFASYFGLTWRNNVFGVALGFGLIATLELLAAALATQSAMFAGTVFDLLPRLAYDLGTVIWVAYLLSPEPARLEVSQLPRNDLEKWNRELLQLLQR